MRKPIDHGRLWDYLLIVFLTSTSLIAMGQQDSDGVTTRLDVIKDKTLACDSDGCTSEDGVLFQLRSKSYNAPISRNTSAHSPPALLQPDRRVTVTTEPPGKAILQGKFAINLPSGGAIWAIEDPTLGLPELSISAPTMVPFDGQTITKPVQFYVRGNYPAFIQHLDITLYRSTDADLIDPIVTIPLAVAAVSHVEWDGDLPHEQYPFRLGDELVYVLRAYDNAGSIDETWPRKLQLVSPEEAEHGADLVRDNLARESGGSLTRDQAQTQYLIEQIFVGNGLRQQNIPLYGSRIRIQGRNIPDDALLTINGEHYPVDLERKFAAEFLAPVGLHHFEIGVSGMGQEELRTEYVLEVDVTGRYFFGVGLADLTLSQNKIKGSHEPFMYGRRDQDDILNDGRLAFYGKAKLQGKYLITAQADTTEQELDRLFNGFTRADPQDVFRRLDPDLYYPVYGDDSTTYRDVDTMGRFYVRADWDKNQALWGNYSTGITGTEFSQYQRSLYGGAVSWRSLASNQWGDPDSELRIFGSQSESALGHSEFIGTGGSLYYLRHTDLLPGSEVVTLEIRDRTTGRVENRVILQRGADYDIDEFQGRILLTRPLAQVTRDNIPTLTRDTPLDGFEQRLLVDYEWVISGFDADDITAGVRGKHWFNDNLGVGTTYVNERRVGEDYTLVGTDLTLQAGKGTYLKTEYSQTESFGAPIFFSDNGGLSFIQHNNTHVFREGEAKAIEARTNFKELGWTEQDWSMSEWWRETSTGYSTARYDNSHPVIEYGAEIAGQFTSTLGLFTRYTQAESGTESLTQAQATLERRLSKVSTLSTELRHVNQKGNITDTAGLLGAMKYLHRIGSTWELYGITQLTLDDDGGKYADNNATTLGSKYLYSDRGSVGAEVTHGDRGDGASVNTEYRLTPEHSIYSAYSYSTDITEYNSLFAPSNQNGWTLGQRWRLSNQVSMYNESQFLKERNQSGLAHTFGMDFYPAQGWNLGFSLSDGELINVVSENVDREAIGIFGGRTTPDTTWQSKMEWREDDGAEQRKQRVSTNRVTHKVNDSWSIATRLNYAETKDLLNPQAGAKFIESNTGFAYRPWNYKRWGLFGRYTYLYDLSTLGQLGGTEYDQESQILSFEGVYELDQQWALAGKLARREGEVRMGRETGEWLDSATTFSAVQLRYELRQKWHVLAEHRWLEVKNGGVKRGWLTGVDRDLGKHFRFGLGYNFTDFSDDLTDFDYDHYGWFINISGFY